jgi:trimeric autotransporter adhesin
MRWILWSLLLPGALAAQNVITTIAGLDPIFNGDGKPAIGVPLGYINGVATDGSGSVYFTDPLEHLLLRVNPDGTLSVVAGNGIAAYSGDGGPATSAAIAQADGPDQYVGRIFEVGLGGIAVDKNGNVYFADGHRVRRVAKDGTIMTLAGGGSQVPGDGGPATAAALGIVTGVALDSAGNLYFCEGNRVRKMTVDGTLTTYAGNDASGYSGDGLASTALLSQPMGLAFDGQGNLYVADGPGSNFDAHIRMITIGGRITTIAGGGTKFPVDGAAPLTLDLGFTSGVAVDSLGAVYVFSPFDGYLLKFSGGSTTLITKTSASAFADNLPARNAYVVGQRQFDNSGIALDAAGNLYVADSRDGRLCKIDKQGILTTLAGNGNYGFAGDGGPAIGAYLQGPAAMTQVPNGTIYFLDTLNVRVRAIAPNGVISSVLSADNFPGLGVAEILNGIASDSSGNVYVLLGDRVLELTPDGNIQVIVNRASQQGDTGDEGPAVLATIQFGGGLAHDAAGNLYISDTTSARIRKIAVDGKIHTIAGTGKPGDAPDGAVAALSPISLPTTLLPDGLGGLYFEELPTNTMGNVVRYITPDGRLKTIAGTGQGGFSGDGGPAPLAGTSMQLRAGLALDKSGNLYLSDSFNNRVRVVSPNGIINTFAGNGTNANAGDGGLARNASLFIPRGLLFTANGDLLISDVAGNRIRRVLAAPPPISVSPTQISFSAKAGGAQTPPQKLTIESPVTGLAFSVGKSPSADWLVIGAGGGATPQLINVRVDPANLSPGNYQATITITSPQAATMNTNIAVTLQVAPGDVPKLAVNKAALSFTFPSNPAASQTQTVRVLNAGSGSLAFTASAQASTGSNWLSVSPASGLATPQSPLQLLVNANPTRLAVGTYTGVLTIASSTTGETVTVPVTMTISNLDQAIRLSHRALSFTAVSGGGIVPPGSFAITNIGRGTMNFTVSTQTLSGGQQWLSATPQSGTATSGSSSPTAAVTVNPAGLAPGFYYGVVRVDSPQAANTPQVATVLLRVLPVDQDPGPSVEPSEIIVTTTQGATSPGSTNILLYNVSAKPQTYVSSFVAASPDYKLSFTPANSTLNLTQPTRLVLQPLTSALAAGIYDAELTLQFSDGFIRRVGVRTIVKPALGSASSASSNASRDTTSCTPSQLIPAITTLGQSFGVPAAWPVALKAEVRDDCGNELDSGTVNVSFSNGDPPLSLQSIQNGLWHTTWVSGRNNGPVTITLTANDPVRNLLGTREVTGGLGDSSKSPLLNAAVSAASFAPNAPLAPGSIISLFGLDLANGTASAGSIPLGGTLAGGTVVMAGRVLPIIFASNGQINAVVSAGININTSQQIIVQRDLTLSVPIPVDVGPAAPAIFGYPFPGDPPNQGAILNALTYIAAHPATPVTAGDVLAIFCTGLGAVNSAVPDGAGAPGSPPASTSAAATATIGGKNAKVTFSGLSPGFVGLYQIDAIVPDGITPSNQVPVIISIASQTSPPATIAVK